MRVLRTAADAQSWRGALGAATPVGLVPTMGFLHEGHLSLVALARAGVGSSGVVAATIFVNPTQFGPNEDLLTYPRDEAGDLAALEREGVDVVFAPRDTQELYPAGPAVWIHVPALEDLLCGRTRPDHFRGVCTVVGKLFGLFRPDVAVFGEKDYQQLTILRRMHRDLFLTGQIVAGPVVREPDGLAKSSRNVRLSTEDRRAARALPDLLHRIARRVAEGECSVAALLSGAEAAVSPMRLEYCEIVDPTTLVSLTKVVPGARCLAAAHLGGVRLIDNVPLG